jgi:hypothetical protein
VQQSVKTPAPEPSLVEEMGKIPYEPLLPVEKQLIAWSIGLGVTLLILLVIVSNLFFR